MNRNRRYLLALLLLPLLTSVLIFTNGCSSSESTVLGKWKHKGSTEVLEFFKDGKFSSVERKKSLEGTWTAIGDGRIRIEIIATMGITVIATATIDGNILVLEVDGEKSHYKRMP